MRRCVLAVAVVLTCLTSVQARGLVIPVDKSIPPLAMLNHRVNVTIDDQVAITKVEQTFRNHTDRQLEATYVFPVPKGASVSKFTMWVDGKEVKGELVEAAKANQIYTDIVRRTQDPGLLEYIGNDLLKPARLPGPAQGRPEDRDQLHLHRHEGPRARRVHLSAQDRRQGDQHARGVHAQAEPEVAAPHPEHLQPDARHHDQPQRRQGSGHRASRRARPCSTRTSSSSTRPATRTSA